MPYQARGENEKGAHGRHRPRLLTAEYVAALRAADRRSTAVDFAADLWPLISKEVCAVYYAALLARRGEPAAAAEEFTERYLHAEPGEAEDRLLEEAGITAAQRWDWERIARPYGTRAFPDLAAFRTWLRGHLDETRTSAWPGRAMSAGRSRRPWTCCATCATRSASPSTTPA